MSRKNLELPNDLKELGAKTISQGECRFCNKASDVVTIIHEGDTPPGFAGLTPIVLHAGKVCDKFAIEFSKPNATAYADQIIGIHKLDE